MIEAKCVNGCETEMKPVFGGVHIYWCPMCGTLGFHDLPSNAIRYEEPLMIQSDDAKTTDTIDALSSDE